MSRFYSARDILYIFLFLFVWPVYRTETAVASITTTRPTGVEEKASFPTVTRPSPEKTNETLLLKVEVPGGDSNRWSHRWTGGHVRISHFSLLTKWGEKNTRISGVEEGFFFFAFAVWHFFFFFA